MASDSHLSYDDVRNALDRALASERGIRIFESSGRRLVGLRQRIFKLRSLDRKRNAELYPPGDANHATSAYDTLSVYTSEAVTKCGRSFEEIDKLPKAELYLEIVKRAPGTLEVQEL